MRILKTALITIIVLTVGVVGYYGYAIWNFGSDDPRSDSFDTAPLPESPDLDSDDNAPKPDAFEPAKWEGTERVNILLLGVDSRGEEKSPRSDTMLVASIDPVTKQAHLFSLLRDTYVNIPGHGRERLNSAVVYGGPKLAMQTVGELTGLDIQYYVYTDFEGFIHLVDEIGGIEFYVEKDMRYTSRADGPEYDINLKEGLQHMDGKTALQYVRFRHDALSDYARTERQRKFISAVVEKSLTPASIIRLPNILKAIDPYIHTNLTKIEMAKLGWLGLEVKSKEIIGVQLPPSNLLREETINGSSVLTVNERQLKEFIQDEFEKAAKPKETEIGPKDSASGDPKKTQGAEG